MAYPETYDTIQGIDLAACAMYSHLMVDGIVNTPGNLAIGGTYTVFARYGSGTPKVDIIDPNGDVILISGATGVWSDVTTLWKFDIGVPSDWPERVIVVKLYSDESPLVYTRHVIAISQTNAYATSGDIAAIGQMVKDEVCGCVSSGTANISTALTNVESGIKQVLSNVTDEINENQVILEKTGFKIIV
jgi:hypothetical protein